jgi:hypothetical protein
MHFSRFLAAWLKDWTALVNLVGSIVFLFWATLWPPSHDQARQALFALCVICFVIGSYRIWASQYQCVCALTGKSPIEAIDDLISEFQKLEDYYGRNQETKPRQLERVIEKVLLELRHHAGFAVHRFKISMDNPAAHTQTFLPQKGKTVQEMADWRIDKKREECWQKTSACLASLKSIKRECVARSYQH